MSKISKATKGVFGIMAAIVLSLCLVMPVSAKNFNPGPLDPQILHVIKAIANAQGKDLSPQTVKDYLKDLKESGPAAMGAARAMSATAVDYPLLPGDVSIVSALDYLRSVQADDGSIGDPYHWICDEYCNSSWAVMAIASAGEDSHNWITGASIVDFLKANAARLGSAWNITTGYELVIMAIVAAGEDPSKFGDGDPIYVPSGDYLSQLMALHNGAQFVDQWGATDTLNDDFWGIIALVAAGVNPQSKIIQDTADWITSNQDYESGGWSWCTPAHPWYSWYGSPDVDDTAAAIMALVAAGRNPHSDKAIQKGLDFLKANQDPLTGGFSMTYPADPSAWNPVNSASTSWAISALAAAGEYPTHQKWTTDAGFNPVDGLLTFQEAGGAFIWALEPDFAWLASREWMTSYAIPSLLGRPYPVATSYILEDPETGTGLFVNTQYGTFRFTAPDGYDSGLIEATKIQINGGQIIIQHKDGDIHFQCHINWDQDLCTGTLKVDGIEYRIFDPPGVE